MPMREREQAGVDALNGAGPFRAPDAWVADCDASLHASQRRRRHRRRRRTLWRLGLAIAAAAIGATIAIWLLA